jgi:hypothetical protein
MILIIFDDSYCSKGIEGALPITRLAEHYSSTTWRALPKQEVEQWANNYRNWHEPDYSQPENFSSERMIIFEYQQTCYNMADEW